MQATPDNPIAEVLCTQLDEAHDSYAPKRDVGMASDGSPIAEQGVATQPATHGNKRCPGRYIRVMNAVLVAKLLTYCAVGF